MDQSMNILPLDQGSDAWLTARLDHYTASEAAAMMNQSKFMSRDQLLDLKKGWISNPDDSFKEKLYADGHHFEEEARPLMAMWLMTKIPPLVGSRVVQFRELSILLLASFDGIALKELSPGEYVKPLIPLLVWEHKGWNVTLAENVRNALLEPHYYWQLEQQMLVSGAPYAVFTVSDGTIEKRVSFKYYPVEGRREALLAGWYQFDKDLNEHRLEAKQEFIPARKKMAPIFPMIEYEVQNGSLVVSNAKNVLRVVQAVVHDEIGKEIESDQDYADKSAFVKAIVKARSDIKDLNKRAEQEFVSYSEFNECLKDIDKVLQKAESKGTGQLTAEKNKKKKVFTNDADAKFKEYILAIHLKIKPVDIRNVPNIDYPDFDKASKNKRTPAAIKSSINAEVARCKIEIDQAVERIEANLALIKESSVDYPQLFNDIQTLALKDNEALQAMVKLRIREHLDAEAIRLKKIEDEAAAQKIANEDAAAKLKKAEEEEAAFEAEREAERLEDLKAKNQKVKDLEQKLIGDNGGTDVPEEKEPEATPEATPEINTTQVTQEEKAGPVMTRSEQDRPWREPSPQQHKSGRMTRKTASPELIEHDADLTEDNEEDLHESVHIKGRMVGKNNYKQDMEASLDADHATIPVDLDNPYVRGYIEGLTEYAWPSYKEELCVGTTMNAITLSSAIDKFWKEFQQDQH